MPNDNEEIEDYEEEVEVLDVDSGVQAADFLALWGRSCCPIVLTSAILDGSRGNSGHSRESIH